jgi:YHS domain-containing protein
MLRFLLLLLLCIFLARILRRSVAAFIEGVSGRPQTPRAQRRGVPMARDPVCGTFVLPERAVMLVDGRSRHYFCSEACRDQYRARTA